MKSGASCLLRNIYFRSDSSGTPSTTVKLRAHRYTVVKSRYKFG